MVCLGPFGGSQEQEGQGEIDGDGGEREDQIDACMPPLVVPKSEQRHGALEAPEESDPAHQHQTAMARGYVCEIVGDRLNHR